MSASHLRDGNVMIFYTLRASAFLPNLFTCIRNFKFWLHKISLSIRLSNSKRTKDLQYLTFHINQSNYIFVWNIYFGYVRMCEVMWYKYQILMNSFKFPSIGLYCQLYCYGNVTEIHQSLILSYRKIGYKGNLWARCVSFKCHSPL